MSFFFQLLVTVHYVVLHFSLILPRIVSRSISFCFFISLLLFSYLLKKESVFILFPTKLVDT